MTNEEILGARPSRRSLLKGIAKTFAIGAMSSWGLVLTQPRTNETISQASPEEDPIDVAKKRKLEIILAESDARNLSDREINIAYNPSDEAMTSFATPEGMFRTSAGSNRNLVDDIRVEGVRARIQNLAKPVTDDLLQPSEGNRTGVRPLLPIDFFVQDPTNETTIPLREITQGTKVSIIIKGETPVSEDCIQAVGLLASMREYYEKKYNQRETEISNLQRYFDDLYSDRKVLEDNSLDQDNALVRMFEVGAYQPNFDELTRGTYRQLTESEAKQLITSAAVVLKLFPATLVDSYHKLTSETDREFVRRFVRFVVEQGPTAFYSDQIKLLWRN